MAARLSFRILGPDSRRGARRLERSVDRGIQAFSEFMLAMGQAGWAMKSPSPRLTHGYAVKTPSIGADSLQTRMVENVSRQLNAGVNILNFTHLETADELRRGIAAMRFRSKGGTRPDEVGMAPALWGLTEQQYREKADVWPLDPNGELIAAPIVESRLGVANVREIAAVKGLGVLVIGAGTLGGAYRGDQPGFEAAVDQILAACREFNVPCGYPVSESNVEAYVKRGFSFFIIQQWGEGAFRTVELGRKSGGR